VVFLGGYTAEQLQRALSTVAGSFSSTALISNVGTLRTSTGTPDPALYGPASTPGQFAGFVYLRTTPLYILDMSVNKEIPITEKVRFTMRLVALNFLNHPFFDIANSSPTSTTFGQITGASNSTRTMQFRASIDW